MMRPDPEVHLRPVRPDDLPTLVAQQMDAESNHMAAFTPDLPEDPNAHRARWERLLGELAHLVRVILHQGEVVGHVASFDRGDEREVTYWIDRSRWGKGLATTALHTFLQLEPARPLHARAAEDNAASLRVLEKCGFRPCGRDKGHAHARGAEVWEVLLVLGTGKEPASDGNQDP